MSQQTNPKPDSANDKPHQPDRRFSRSLPTAFAILGFGAFLAAAYYYGHTEFSCVKVTRTRVDAKFTEFHWFDLTSSETFELAGVKSASIYEPGVILIGTGGEDPSGYKRFAGELPTASTITELILRGRVGQTTAVADFKMRIVSAIMAGIGVLLFWACRKTLRALAVVNAESGQPTRPHDTANG
jgi:hypothetical protein